MKKLLLLLALFTAQTIYAGELQLNAGGTITDTSALYTGSLSYANKDKTNTPWSQYLDSDFFYSQNNGNTSRNEFNAYGKINYELNEKNYLQTAMRYEFNQFAPYQNKLVTGVGHGYRLFHTDTLKVSAETSVAMAEATNLNQAVFRESIWASYIVGPKTSISNKFLLEIGGPIDYKRNVFSVSYAFTEHVIGSITNTLAQDWRNTNTTTFTVGVKF